MTRHPKPDPQLILTFSNGKTEQVRVVTAPLGSNYTPRAGGTAEVEAANAYRAAVHGYQMRGSVTARAGLLVQNPGAETAEDVLVSIVVPPTLQLSFAEEDPPPKSTKVPKKPPLAPLEPSPRAWRSDSESEAHCRVVRVTSSVGLPQLFLTLKDPAERGSFEIVLKVSAARPAIEQVSRLTVQFVQPEVQPIA